MSRYRPGDIVWICGVEDPRVNRTVRGVVHHVFEDYGMTFNVIAVDVLDGDFEVRCDNTAWPTELGFRDPSYR